MQALESDDDMQGARRSSLYLAIYRYGKRREGVWCVGSIVPPPLLVVDRKTKLFDLSMKMQRLYAVGADGA